MFALALRPRWDHRLGPEIENGVVEIPGIIGEIGDDMAWPQPLQKVGAVDHIAAMARPQDKANRQAEGIDGGVDLRA